MNITLENIWNKISMIGYNTIKENKKYKKIWKNLKKEYKNYGIYRDINKIYIDINCDDSIQIKDDLKKLFKFDKSYISKKYWPKEYPDRWKYEGTYLYYSHYWIIKNNKYKLSLIKLLKIAYYIGILKYLNENQYYNINNYYIDNKLNNISTYVNDNISKLNIRPYIISHPENNIEHKIQNTTKNNTYNKIQYNIQENIYDIMNGAEILLI